MTAEAAGDDGARVRAEAAAMFGAVLPRAEMYARLLSEAGTERGIVGPAEAARIWERHLLNCGVIAPLIPPARTLVDVGSGAGLPGLVLAMLLQDCRVTLVEPTARRIDFLTECVDALGLGNVDVLRARAEDLAGRLSADVVTSRAVAPLDRLASISAGLARPGGRVVAIKGSSAATELARAGPVLARLGITDAGVQTARSASGRVTATVVTFTVSATAHGGSSCGPSSRRGGE